MDWTGRFSQRRSPPCGGWGKDITNKLIETDNRSQRVRCGFLECAFRFRGQVVAVTSKIFI